MVIKAARVAVKYPFLKVVAARLYLPWKWTQVLPVLEKHVYLNEYEQSLI